MPYKAIILQANRAVRHPRRPGAAGQYRFPQVSVVERQVPALSAGQVLLEVCNVSVCGTDVHVLQTDAEGFSCSSVPAAHWEEGIQFGHEVAARVIAVAPGGQNVAVGDFVTADSLVPCRRPECRTCRAGLWNSCPQACLLGLEADGAFGEFAVVPAASVHSIAPLISRYGTLRGLRLASLAEPLGVALHAYAQANRWLRQFRPRVLVLGAGAIGQFFAWKSRLAGAESIVIVEPNIRRAELAREFADLVIHPDDFDAAFPSDAFDSSPDIVLDACGQAAITTLLQTLAPGGVLVTVARTGQQICFESDRVITNGQAIVGIRGHVGYLPEAIGLLSDCDIDPEKFITRSFDGLSQLHAALKDTKPLADELKVSCQISAPRHSPRRS
jgi:threonine dehydrogenase-like Zn-dependent dehydrogenase